MRLRRAAAGDRGSSPFPVSTSVNGRNIRIAFGRGKTLHRRPLGVQAQAALALASRRDPLVGDSGFQTRNWLSFRNTPTTGGVLYHAKGEV